MKSKYIEYFSGQGKDKNWLLKEKEFNPFNQGKFETIFSQGNGYIGTRSALEEEYPNQHRGLFIASTFNQVAGPEVSELPNAADTFGIALKIDGEQFNMLTGTVSNYERVFSFKDGEIIRSLTWKGENDKELDLKFERMISFDNLHLISTKVTVAPKQGITLNWRTGINGQMNNSGAQHFEDTDSTFLDEILEYVFTTTESQIDFVWNKKVNLYLNGNKIEIENGRLSSVYGYDRRTLMRSGTLEIKAGDVLEIEANTTVRTTRDLEYHDKGISREEIRALSKEEFNKIADIRYEVLAQQNTQAWENYWKEFEIKVDTEEDFDIISIRFHQYHTRRFTPAHDWRANLEAKGFAGEEYKGHTFWDTEIYVYPYFLYTDPMIARNLMKHRYFVRNAAYIKAKENNQIGMMWPWETTWHDKGETCPVWGAVDRKEGYRIKVWPAFNQLHIGGCIAWGIFQYHATTKDDDFMNKYGYEVFFDTARFWTNRLEYNESLDRYEITKVTGPNEYKEDIDNNAWTNYLIWFNLSKSLEYLTNIKDSIIFETLNDKLNLVQLEEDIKAIVDKIYLPQPNENGIIPENDTFLQLEDVDMKYYKEHREEFWQKWTFPEMNKLQTLKQADIVGLMYVLGFLFDKETITKNWKYYEERTLHDSSLSLSMHTITANYAEDKSFAYEFFKKAALTDLGPEMGSCNNGFHSANAGGLLQALIVGFGGVKSENGMFHIDPNLPAKWNKLDFNVYIELQKVNIRLTKEKIEFKNLGSKQVEFNFRGKQVKLEDELTIAL